MNISIKRATAENTKIISKIYASSWKVAYKGIVPQPYLDELKDDFWAEPLKDWMINNSLKADILFQDNMPIGCICYGKSRDKKLTDWGEIISIYIDPEFYRKGYGQKLLKEALEEMRRDGYKNCYLWVLAENFNAQGFYKSNGFISTEDTYQFEIMGKPLIDLRYIYHL